MGKGLLYASSRVESISDTCIVEEEAHHEVVTFAGMRKMIIIVRMEEGKRAS